MNPISQQTNELPLRDIHLPEAISWFPPAPGWWILLVLLILIPLVVVWVRRRLARRRPIKAALAELAQIEATYGTHGDPDRLMQELSSLLRRVALIRYPRQEVAGLQGEAWLRFLDEPLPEKGFLYGAGKVLATAPYRPCGDLDPAPVLGLCRSWLKHLPHERRRT